MIYFFYGILSVYSLLILLLVRGIGKLSNFNGKVPTPLTGFSILIVFRNEADRLPRLLESLAYLEYPKNKIEIIFIDDHSTDQSVTIVNAFDAAHPEIDVKILQNATNGLAPKKEAIELGIQNSSHHWIVTTDADCQVSSAWLKTFDAFIQTHSVEMLVGPVRYSVKDHFLHNFQNLDFMSLQGSTMGLFGLDHQFFTRPVLCNGANFCYKKSLFEKVGGYKGNQQIPSGDDIFLLEKVVSQFPDKVKFVKSLECLVETDPKESLNSLINQRVRWASKTKASTHIFAKFTGVWVFLTSLSLILSFILSISGLVSWMHSGLLFLIKFNTDFVLLQRTGQFLQQEGSLRHYFKSAFLHPIFTVCIFILSLFSGYSWKARNYK